MKKLLEDGAVVVGRFVFGSVLGVVTLAGVATVVILAHTVLKILVGG